MSQLLGDDDRIPEKVVAAVLVAALAVGVLLYNVISFGSSGAEDPVQPALLGSSTTTAAPAAIDENATPAPVIVGSIPDTFGDDVAAGSGTGVDDAAVAGTGDANGIATPPETPTPRPAPIPAPTCPTDVANDAYEQVAGPVGDALGQPLPADDLRVLAEIAAGCSAEPATTPLIGLALSIGRLLPSTGQPPVDLSAIPAVEAPPLPRALIDALAPVQGPIQDGCGGVGLLGVLLAVAPGAANVPVHGQDLADAIVPAQTLCAQFE